MDHDLDPPCLGIDYLFSVDGGGTNSAPHLCRRGCVADDSECHMIVGHAITEYTPRPRPLSRRPGCDVNHAQLLLDSGGDLRCKTMSGMNPLMCAVQQRWHSVSPTSVICAYNIQQQKSQVTGAAVNHLHSPQKRGTGLEQF